MQVFVLFLAATILHFRWNVRFTRRQDLAETALSTVILVAQVILLYAFGLGAIGTATVDPSGLLPNLCFFGYALCLLGTVVHCHTVFGRDSNPRSPSAG